MRAKLGLAREDEGDRALCEGLLEQLAAHHVDYALFFRRLCAAAADPSLDLALTSSFGADLAAIRSWMEAWRRRIAIEPGAPEARAAAMRRANPAFIPRNHRVEEAIEAEAVAQALCMTTGDFRRAHEAFVAKRKPVFAGD